MKTVLKLGLLAGLVAGSVPVRAADLQASVDQAAAILKRFKERPEKSIPDEALRDAKGLAITTVVKAGLIFGARGGDGVAVARVGKGWSSPSGIGTGGAGFGLQIGAQATEFVFVLNTPEAVRVFAHGNLALGADLSVAAGPAGRHLEAGVMPTAAVYTYSLTQGAFAGVSIEGAVIVTRKERNADYYGHPVEAEAILRQSAAAARRATLDPAIDELLKAAGAIVVWRRNGLSGLRTG